MSADHSEQKMPAPMSRTELITLITRLRAIFGRSFGTVLNSFTEDNDALEFAVLNEIFWDQDELEYIQTHSVDLDHLLFVYRKYMGALTRCIELVESNVVSKSS